MCHFKWGASSEEASPICVIAYDIITYFQSISSGCSFYFNMNIYG